MTRVWLTSGALVLGMASFVLAQVPTVERTAKAQSAKDARIGVYVNVQPDCSSGVLPTIRLVSPPAHGKVTVKKGKMAATNYRQCLALEVPAYIAIYRSLPDFAGTDRLSVEIKYHDGKIEIQNVTVTVGPAAPEKSI